MKQRPIYCYTFTACVFALLLAIPARVLVAEPLADTHRLIVKFASPVDTGLSTEQLERLSGHAGVPLAESHIVSDNACVLLLPQQVSTEEATRIAARLAADPAVEYAEPDRLKRPVFVPDDPFFFQQWNLVEDAGGIRVQTAWDTEPGAPGIVVAMVDSGILVHGDLDPLRQVPGYDFITNPLFANDGDGRDADPSDPGDWVAAGECGPGDPQQDQDSSWHGTAVTGVIGAATDNNMGIAGVNIGSRLLMARALGKCGGFTSDIMEAARWAAGLPVPGVPDNANPARVINLSFSGLGGCTLTEQNAINAINARGGVVVVAAGNQAGDVALHSPANCSGVVTVAATTRSGARAAYTNTGNEVDVSAPGGDVGIGNGIRSVYNNGDMAPAADSFVSLAGTSFATAHVSGVAALVLSVNENLSSQQVRDILVASTRPFPDASCDQLSCGSGILDANAAVLLAGATPGQPDNDNDGVNDAVDACPGTPAGAVVDAAGCSAAQLGGGGGGGGGGCSVSRHAAVDPLLPVLLLFAVLNLIRGRHCPGRSNPVVPGRHKKGG